MVENDKRRARFNVQNFLRLGAAKDPQIKRKKTQKILLFSSCFYALRRFLRPKRCAVMPNRKALEAMNLPRSRYGQFMCVSETPLMQARRAFALRKGLFRGGNRKNRRQNPPRNLPVLPTPKAVSSGKPFLLLYLTKMSDADAMSDEIYARFAERSVGVENRIPRFSHRL